jgi:ketosteroid isomerase-like protein
MVKILICGSVLLAAGCATYQPERDSDLPAVNLAERQPDADLLAEPFRPIEDVLNDFHDAASKADFNRYFSHWTDTSVFLGTDDWERWVGQEFKDYAKARFDTGKGWTYTVKERHADFSPDGKVAWFDEMLHNAKVGTCRGSGVLVKTDGEGGGWKIMQYNLSLPIPNEMIEDVAKKIMERAADKRR